MSIKTFALNCIEAGIKVVPTTETKNPIAGYKWKEGDPTPHLDTCFGIGIQCGGAMGIQCIDFDPKIEDLHKVFGEFYKLGNCKEYFEQGQMIIEMTPSGGYHIVIRSDEPVSNMKLARNGNECFIETRGEGGYFCCSPTPGYDWISDDDGLIYQLWDLDPITVEQRNDLIALAKSFDRVEEEEKKITHYGDQKNTTETPWYRYCNDPSCIEECKDLLSYSGWTEQGQGKWSRPGKSEGVSGKWGEQNPYLFYNWSSNAGLEVGQHNPFQLFTFLKHGGDYSAAGKELAQRYKSNKEADVPDTFEVSMSALDRYRVDPTAEIEAAPSILNFREVYRGNNKDVPVLHENDFSLLIGKQKSKKSFLSSMIVAAMVKKATAGKFISALKKGKDRVAYFDTEQGTYYALRAAKRISGLSGSNDFDYFGLRKANYSERIKLIEEYLKEHDNCGFLVIDGCVDLVKDFNDYSECLALSQWLMELTAIYNCHIMCVLHENKADRHARGHLGTVLSQKCETVIGITKDEQEESKSEVMVRDTRGPGFKRFEIKISEDGIPEVIPEKVYN